jgi:hypothetical protein
MCSVVHLTSASVPAFVLTHLSTIATTTTTSSNLRPSIRPLLPRIPALGQKMRLEDMKKLGTVELTFELSGWIAGKIRILNCEFGLSDYGPLSSV